MPPASAKLIAELRDSSGYLADQGWQQTAIMMILAADELERLSIRVAELQSCKAEDCQSRHTLREIG